MASQPKRGWRILLLVVIVAALAFVGGRMFGAAPAPAAGGPGGPKPATVMQVTVTEVANKEFADNIEALGTTRANETVELTAQLSEIVKDIYFEDGQVVRRDDVLLVLGNAEEVANLDAAKALAAERKSAYERAADLEKKKIIAREVYETRRAEWEQAEASVCSLQSLIDNTIIKAPFDGILGLRNVSPGALVQPGTMITTIDDLSLIKVDFEVPALYLQDLKPGLPVTGTVEGLPDRQFRGTVATVNTQVDPVTRAVRLRAVIPNPDLALRPGLLMNVTLDTRARQALTVPEGALIQQRDQTIVYVAEEGEEGKTLARRVEIKRGARRLGEVEVVSGLEAGQRVITTGFMRLADGDTVKIIDAPVGAVPASDAVENVAPAAGPGAAAP